MYKELSVKTMDIAMGKLKEIIKGSYESCKNEYAWHEYTWHESNTHEFNLCTEDIIKSNSEIGQIFEDIEKFSENQMISKIPIESLLGPLMEDVNLTPFGSEGVKKAAFYIKTAAASFPTSNLTCSQHQG